MKPQSQITGKRTADGRSLSLSGGPRLDLGYLKNKCRKNVKGYEHYAREL